VSLWTQDEFDRIFAEHQALAERFLMSDGKVIQKFLILGNIDTDTGKAGKTVFPVFVPNMPEGMDGEHAKHHLLGLVRKLCVDLDASGVLQQSEVWIRDTTPESVRKHFPEADPDKLDAWFDEGDNYERFREKVKPREALIIMGEFQGVSKSALNIFTRTRGGKPILGEWDCRGETKGRFTRLLPGARGN